MTATTRQLDKALSLVEKGASYRAAARETGVAQKTLQRWCDRKGVRSNLSKARWSKDEIDAAAEMWALGYRVEDIARELGRNETSVKNCASNHRDRFPSRGREGKRYPIARVEIVEAENAKLRELVERADRLMQGVLDNSSDTVVVSGQPCCDTLYDALCAYRRDARILGVEVGNG